jgi:hypothetical protein
VREIRLHGSEGGGIEINRSFLPLSGRGPRHTACACYGEIATAHGVCLLVRLQLYRISRVKVSAGVLWHSVTKSNCVAARRGGKQLEVND